LLTTLPVPPVSRVVRFIPGWGTSDVRLGWMGGFRWASHVHLRSGLRYNAPMALPQCKAIIFFGRDTRGNRSGLVPPRICQRVATQGEYCGLHARQAELQDLYRQIFGYGWEYKVTSWEDKRRREREKEGLRVARGMVDAARELELNKLATFLSINRFEVAKVWGEAQPK